MSPKSPALLLAGAAAAAMAAPPPALPPTTALADAIAAMVAARSSCVLAVDRAGRPVGILTEQDIARRVTFRLDASAPLEQAMTAPLIACAAGDGLWRAIALLRAHRLRHLPVLDAEGRCVGLLQRADALAAASGHMLLHLDALAGDEIAVKRAQAGLAAALLAEGLSATEVVALVNGINLDLHRTILARTVAAQPAPPPVDFALLAMGSLGRGESLLGPDQDNGFVLQDYPDDRHDGVDAWFRPMAEEFCLALDQAGFTLCPGGIMAMNPLWRKTRAQWRDQMALWARRRSGAALLFADIAFDFRLVTGDSEWGAGMRRDLAATLKAQPALLAALAAQDSRLRVGLTFWGGFADDEPGPGTRTDLKLHGLMPLVAAVRLASLGAGIAETATPARLTGLVAAGSLAPDDGARLQVAFTALLDAVLRQQLADHTAGLRPGNLVETGALPDATRRDLRDALRAVRAFSKSAFAGFTGELW
jgi:signal-transduction protein with cAMP-binding, CBS, and nucleotidyltransferase domain